jgi:hypothetical protein
MINQFKEAIHKSICTIVGPNGDGTVHRFLKKYFKKLFLFWKMPQNMRILERECSNPVVSIAVKFEYNNAKMWARWMEFIFDTSNLESGQ